jgi:SAM-dependent methyltransferase
MTARLESKPYWPLIAHYEACLARHGDSHLGVDWPNREDAATRYQVMLDLVRPARDSRAVSLLDFGCGASHLYEHIRARGLDWIEYAGLDLSAQFIELSRRKFPDRCYYQLDLLEARADTRLPAFDYIVLNGVLTEKRELAFNEMWDYARRLLRAVFAKARVGLAFNVMSPQVDWERADLFHLPLDALTGFLSRELSRHFVIRHDYGLYEYTTYLYREAGDAHGSRGEVNDRDAKNQTG